MLFLQAILGLLIYDILATFGRFEHIYVIVKCWKVAARHNRDRTMITRICEAVNQACIWYPKRALCLQRSFVMTYLLRKYGIRAELVLGAQRFPFKAHA